LDDVTDNIEIYCSNKGKIHENKKLKIKNKERVVIRILSYRTGEKDFMWNRKRKDLISCPLFSSTTPIYNIIFKIILN